MCVAMLGEFATCPGSSWWCCWYSSAVVASCSCQSGCVCTAHGMMPSYRPNSAVQAYVVLCGAAAAIFNAPHGYQVGVRGVQSV